MPRRTSSTTLRAIGASLFDAPVRAMAVVGGASEALGQLAALTADPGGEVVLVASDFPKRHVSLAGGAGAARDGHPMGRRRTWSRAHGSADRWHPRGHDRRVLRRGPIRHWVTGRRCRGDAARPCRRGPGDRRRHADGRSDACEHALRGTPMPSCAAATSGCPRRAGWPCLPSLMTSSIACRSWSGGRAPRIRSR